MSVNYDELSDLPLRSGDSQTLDWEDVKEDTLWEVPEEWWSAWGDADIIYHVDVDLPGETLANDVWDELAREYSTEDEALLCGGASIERLTETTFRVVSGGEDGLDSLSYTVNDALLSTVERLEPGADWAITSQGRKDD